MRLGNNSMMHVAGVTASPADVVSMYKREFFEAYGQLLTEIIDTGYDGDLRVLVNITTIDIMLLRDNYHRGADTEEDWFNALMKLIAAANNAAGFIRFANIALRASSLVVDGVKIIKEMKMAEECRGNPLRLPGIQRAGASPAPTKTEKEII